MPFGEIGAWLLVLFIVFAAGSLWFHAVEAVLARIKRHLTRHRKPPAWHPLPPDEEDSREDPSQQP